MIYLFSSKPQTVEKFFRDEQIEYQLVDKDKYGVFLQTYIPSTEDLGIVYDFGKIIPEELLQNLLLLNLHFSLLPKYRGSIPVEAAIKAGETVTGITIQKMANGIDVGDILLQETVEIHPDWSAGELQLFMDSLLPSILKKLFEIPRSEWKFVPQVGEPSVCYMRELNRENAYVDFGELDSKTVINLIRAFNPEPYAWTNITKGSSMLAMNLLRATDYPEIVLAPSEILFQKGKGLAIGCASGTVLITNLVISGSKPLAGADIVSLKGSILLAK